MSNDFECPNCFEWLKVPIPYARYVDCPSCRAKLEIHPDAEFDEGVWHDLTELSIVEEEHMKRMLNFALEKEQDGTP